MISKVFRAVGVVVFCAASAHVTLESPQTPVGAPYKAVLRVPHGCEGSATIALRIRVPEGMIAVKPMPKPGWKGRNRHRQISEKRLFPRSKASEGVVEISFTGGTFPTRIMTNSSSPDSSPAISTRSSLYVPVVQECEKGINR